MNDSTPIWAEESLGSRNDDPVPRREYEALAKGDIGQVLPFFLFSGSRSSRRSR
jgi:hypothetical protein